MAGRTLWFVAESEKADGKTESYYVYRKGSSIYISSPKGHEHLCHPSVTDQDRVINEILLVYNATARRVLSQSDLS